MIEACAAGGVPLWVAYYRRALPRFLFVRDLLAANAIGTVTSVHVAVAEDRWRPDHCNWRFDPAIAGAGLFFDLGSHCVDLLDFFLGPITGVAPVTPVSAGGVTAASLGFERARMVGTGI